MYHMLTNIEYITGQESISKGYNSNVILTLFSLGLIKMWICNTNYFGFPREDNCTAPKCINNHIYGVPLTWEPKKCVMCKTASLKES